MARWGERTEIARAAHPNWMQRVSRISTGERRAERGVELWIGGWLQGEPRSGDGVGERRSHGAVTSAGSLIAPTPKKPLQLHFHSTTIVLVVS